MTMIEVKTADLTGRALDWAVAAAEGLDVVLQQIGDSLSAMAIKGSPVVTRHGRRQPVTPWNPTTRWDQAGPLIEKYKVMLSPPTSMVHRNFGYMDERNGYYEAGFWGSTIFGKDRKHRRTAFHHPDSPLIVAMRAIVQFELGDTVQVPKELLP